MDYINIKTINNPVSRIGIGTSSIDGLRKTDEKKAIDAIQKALDLGINFIDTAPVDGFGESEAIVGKALKEIKAKNKVFVATKVGLNWKGKTIFRDCRKDRIIKEVEDSLKRLQIDSIDLYQIQWLDPLTPFEETALALIDLLLAGKIKAIGVCNFSIDQIEQLASNVPILTEQSPFNLFENQIQNNVLEYCNSKNIALLGHDPLCRDLLSHKIRIDTQFGRDDIRLTDPKFKIPRLEDYLKCVENLNDYAKRKFDKTVQALSVRYVLDKNIDVALLGITKPGDLSLLDDVFGWKLTKDELREIDQIVVETILESVGPEFMAPISRLSV